MTQKVARSTYVSSTVFLSMLARYGAHLVEKRPAANARPEEATIVITSDSGSDLENKSAGFWAAPLQLPCSIFDDFVAASLIHEDVSASKSGSRVFRLTEEGRQRGLAVPPFWRS